jgi:hypothetical protein
MTEKLNTNEIRTLTVEDFEQAFGEKLNKYVSERVNQYSFKYVNFKSEEIEELLIKIIQTLLDPNVQQSGEHRIDQWEAGWGENLEMFLKNPKDLDLIMPKYFNKYGAIRWRGKFIRPISEKFECHSLAIIQDWLFDKYLRNVESVYEFGCGTGHNLLRVRGVNKTASLYGLDWATSSQKIIERMVQNGIDSNLNGKRFDYFNPDETFKLKAGSAVYTVASLEQVGQRWEKFIEYIIMNKPEICIHIEPISELLNANNLIDYLSIEYFKKRNYLNGFLHGLRKLENEGKLTIHRAQRTNLGSLFIEGYSVIVWSPTKM